MFQILTLKEEGKLESGKNEIKSTMVTGTTELQDGAEQ